MISIILPVYNGKQYLQQALDSVAKQTYADFECLCIDDGSVDGSASIVEGTAEKDSRFRLIKQKNCGVASARNKGLDEAKGEYITFLDQDDALVPVALERMLSVAKDTGCGVVAAGIYEFTDEGLPNVARNDKREVNVSETPLRDFWDWDKVRRIEVSVWGKLYSRESLNGVRFPDGVFGADDYVFSARLFSVIPRYVSTDEKLYLYRMHPDNVTSQMPMRYIMGMLKSREITWMEIFVEGKVSEDISKKVSQRFCKEIISWAVKKTCRQTYNDEEMEDLRKEVALLLRERVLVPCSLRDKLKTMFFCKKKDWALRVLFPSLYKRK